MAQPNWPTQCVVASNVQTTNWHASLWLLEGDLCTLLRPVTWLFMIYGMVIMPVTAQEPPVKANASAAEAPAK